MTEAWLQPNRRALLLALAPIGLAIAAGLVLVACCDLVALRALGGGFLGVAAVLCVGMLQQWRRPRIAFRDGSVLFSLRSGPPIGVPVEVVEAFFLGQGPAHLPPIEGQQPATVNLVARLSQKAPQWEHVAVKPALGHWSDSYVVIRGTWCEPLTGDVIRRLNRRLRELHDAHSRSAPSPPAPRTDEAPA